jgi:hypothetical protein
MTCASATAGTLSARYEASDWPKRPDEGVRKPSVPYCIHNILVDQPGVAALLVANVKNADLMS